VRISEENLFSVVIPLIQNPFDSLVSVVLHFSFFHFFFFFFFFNFIMRNFRKEDVLSFYYSIHCFFLFFVLLCPSSLDCSFSSFLCSFGRSSSSSFLVNAQLKNYFLQIVAGSDAAGYNNDNQPATSAKLNFNEDLFGEAGGVYGDINGTVYIGDAGNYRLRKINLLGIITTIAGTGTASSNGYSGAGTSVDVGLPFFITGDTMGSFLYFSDFYFVWKYQLSNGFLSRYAGDVPSSYGFNGDGQQATTALFNKPYGLSLSTMGLLYIADYENNRLRVIATNGIISTFAGSGPEASSGVFGGDGGLAISTSCKINRPSGVYADTIGNVFFADYGNNRIRKVDSSGIIRTFAGGGNGGDGVQATSASLTSSGVRDVKGDRVGNIYIADNCKIRMVNTAGIITRVVGTSPTCGYTQSFSAATTSPIKTVYSFWVNSISDLLFTEQPGLVHKTVTVAFPTSQPSRCPSSQPSVQPVSRPSSHPSIQPTSRPSSQPSCYPLARPSSYPTNKPSACPSGLPLASPSSEPTNRPSSRPSYPPSSAPSHCPTVQPTTSPSTDPSVYPSASPSTSPSSQPSRSPISRPSCQPSSRPSICPTIQPSSPPSTQPTCQPSEQPFGLPSSHPTHCPAAQPSNRPSSQPSVWPTIQPLSSPSTQPSSRPSVLPTAVPSNPSAQPSTRPSDQPSARPSNQPTRCPLSQPSCRPSSVPSHYPTTVPSACPSLQPFSFPSGQPSSFPSSRPSSLPSSPPSHGPTTKPSASPSVQPTTHPSITPSAFPSNQPTGCPLSRPSCQPSSQPSVWPTIQPSSSPSTQPTCQPFGLPSSSPTHCPLAQPSNRPSSQPSRWPTIQPSSSPSTQPTCQPSEQPFGLPSSRPTHCPLAQPSNRPSSQPSRWPTIQPLSSPSTQPTCQPSEQPFGLPSSRPTHCPLAQPSNRPSSQPSVWPTIQPSSSPSTQPTCQPSEQPFGLPSSHPTHCPLAQPSNRPSSQPSVWPTIQPLSSPSTQPSSRPSVQPSLFPSYHPASQLSPPPNGKPSSYPSSQPSHYPTTQPFSEPSTVPSSCPTSLSSAVPSACPSDQPSSRPSFHPYGEPTLRPSNRVSCHPSGLPSSNPSTDPTCAPSYQPYAKPSSTPREPTSYPTKETRAPVIRSSVLPSLSVLPVSSSRLLFHQMNFLLGAGISASISFRNILLSRSPVFPCKSYLLLGSKVAFPSGFDLSLSNHLLVAPVQTSRLSIDSLGARAIAFGGDFNHDRLPELLIGSPLSSKVYIIYSSRSNREWSNVTDYSVLTGEKESSNGLGWAVSSAGDFNKDGVEDIVISAVYSNKVYLLKGKHSLNISQSTNIEDYLIAGEGSDQQSGWILSIRKDPLILSFGAAVSFIKDFNGDNYDDIVISAFGTSGANRIFIVLGGSSFSSSIVFLNDLSPTSFSAVRVITIVAPTFSFAGLSLSGVGDINGDGLGELLIGSVPYNKGYSTQQSYLLYGSRSSSKYIFLSNFTIQGKGSIIKGGGFLVNGIGDINNDGYDDMMITSYSDWQGKSGFSYLMVFPNKEQWISNIPSLIPSSSPSSGVSASPTSFPSSVGICCPTGLPSVLSEFPSSLPSSLPSFKNASASSRTPTFLTSVKPSRVPSFLLSIVPTIVPSFKPSLVPSVSPTHTFSPSLIPSISPSTCLPTKKPSFKPSSSSYPSFSPTSLPSLSASSQGRAVLINSGGNYEGGIGDEVLVISSKNDIIIKGNPGKKRFVISSSIGNNVTVTILDFNCEDEFEDNDVLDFSQLATSASSSFSYSYSTNPLTFLVASYFPDLTIRIILSSHSDYDLNEDNIILPSFSLFSSSTSTSSSFESLHISSEFTGVVIPLIGLFVILVFLLNYRRRGYLANNKKEEKAEKARRQADNGDDVDDNEFSNVQNTTCDQEGEDKSYEVEESVTSNSYSWNEQFSYDGEDCDDEDYGGGGDGDDECSNNKIDHEEYESNVDDDEKIDEFSDDLPSFDVQNDDDHLHDDEQLLMQLLV
jgi:hypothetical protein